MQPRHAAAALALLALLQPALAQDPASVRGEGSDSLRLLTVLESSDLGAAMPLESFDAYGAALADLDGDGRHELILLNDNSRAYVLDLLRGTVRAELATPHPGNTTSWHTQTLNGVAVGDLEGDGLPDLVVLNTGGQVTRFERDFGLDDAHTLGMRMEWTRLADAPEMDPSFWDRHPWLTPTPPADRTHLAHGHPFLAHVPGAASAWVFTQADGIPGQFAFHADGTLAWMDAWNDGHAGPWVGPLRAGGAPVALFATDAGRVVARMAATGQEVWTYQVPASEARPGSFSVPPAVADLDGDGTVEMLVGARVAVERGPGAAWMREAHVRLVQLGADGHPQWSVALPFGNPMLHSRALALDVQGDGVRDWVLLDWNTIGHKPGNMERLGPGNLVALDGRNGDVLWTVPVDAPQTDFDLAVATVAGAPAAVAPHARDGHPGVGAFRLTDGSLVAWAALPDAWTTTRGAFLDDVDGDGLLEAIVPVHRPGTACVPKPDVECRAGAIALLATDAPTASLAESGADAHADRPLAALEGRSVQEGGAGLPADGAPRVAQAPLDAGSASAFPWWGVGFGLLVAVATLAAFLVVRRT